MKLLFVHDGPVFYDEKGNFYEFAYHNLLERYSYLANDISFLMRTKEVSKNKKYTLVPSKIKIVSVPNFKSIKSLKNIFKAKKIIKNEIENNDYIVFRVPSTISEIGIKYAEKNNKLYIVECVGCPWDSYWNHSLLGKIYAPYAYYRMKKKVRNAKYVYYVTNEFLQRRYPTDGKSISCSNVVLDSVDNSVLEKRIKKNKDINVNKEIVLGTAAALDVRYKGQEYVIKAIAELNREGYNFKYELAGGYTSQTESKYLQECAVKYGVEDKVIFRGSLNSEEIKKYYDDIDIYIQPSKQEGLPRAVIEAMSRGCPCIGTNIAGIPELLQKEFLFSKGNVKELKEKILLIINSDVDKISQENFEKSKDYIKEKLNRKRKKFYDTFLNDLK